MWILNSIQIVDERIFTNLFRGKRRLKKLALWLSHSADGFLYITLPLLYWLVNPETGGAFFKIALLAFVIERFIYFILKKNLKRKRPPAAIPGFKSLVTPSDEFSFPSGHTSGAFLFTTLCVLWFGAVAAPLYLWALCVGFSRVLLGVHFPTDILAGAVVGAGVGLTIIGYFV